MRLCCGVPIGFETHTNEWLRSLASVIPGVPCDAQTAVQAHFSIRRDEQDNESRGYEVRVNGTRIRGGMSAQSALTFLERHVPEAVSVLAAGFVLLHAAVVGWQGRAILLPGSSWSGKTTLAMALVEAGATYYSDEYAVLDRNARVHSYLRPPRVRAGNDTARRLEDAISLGLRPPPPLPVGLVLISSYSENAVWRPRPLTCSEALFEMLAHGIAVRYKPELSLRVLREVSSRARSFKTERGDARATAKVVLHRLMRKVSVDKSEEKSNVSNSA